MNTKLFVGVLLIYVFVLQSVNVLGASTNSSVEIMGPDSIRTIYMGQKNNIEITVKNIGDASDTFYVSLWPNQWSSVDRYSVTIGPSETGIFVVTLEPPRNSQKGVFLYTFSVASVSTSKSTSKDLLFNFKRDMEIYLSELKINSQILNVGETLLIQPVITNLNEVKPKDILITTKIFRDNLLIQKFEDQIRIDPDSTRTVTNDLQIPNTYGYGEFKVLIELKDALNNLLDDAETSFKIKEKSNFMKSKNVEYGNTFITITLSVTNNGNIPNADYTITESLPVIMRYFFYPDEEPNFELVKDNRIIYEWKVSDLEPNEAKIIKYQLRFQNAILGALIVVASLFAISYVFFRPTVHKKYTKPLAHEKEVTVSLHIRNKSTKEIRNIIVRDLVPPVAKVVKKFDTITPSIKLTTKGTRLTWNVDRINPREEVVLTYNIIPMMEILGGFKLPKVHMTYEGQGGIIGRIASKIVSMGSK